MSEAFLKVVNMSISAGWLALAVLILRILFKKAPRWVSVLLWGMVAIRLLCPVSIESALSLIPSKETIQPEIMMDWTPEITTGIETLDQVVNPVISTSFAPEPYASANPLQILIPVAANIWLLGVLVMLTYTAISYLALRKKLRTAVLLQKNIFQSEAVQSPFVLGILRPQIFLPYTIDGMELHHVVAHEKAHIRRKDHWWKPFGFLLLSIYWFHPLLWVAYILLCRDIELACDEKVIAKLDAEQRADYTQALVSCSVNRRRIAACPLAFGEVGVKDRVKSIMNYRKPAFWIVLIAVVTCMIVAVCFLTDPVQNTDDLSFLNYKHAVSLSAQQDVIPAVHYSSEKDQGVIGICMVEGVAFSEYLDEAKWNEKWFAPSDLSSPGSAAVNVAENLRITVYDRNFAAVNFNEEVRYYRIANDDYEKILALLLPADETRLENSSASRLELALGMAVIDENTDDYPLSKKEEPVSTYEIYNVAPLEELPDTYTLEEATIDKCVMVFDGEIRDNEDVWQDFCVQTSKGQSATVRIVHYYHGTDSSPALKFIFDLTYDGKIYELRWFEEGKAHVEQYLYLRYFDGIAENENAAYDAYKSYILTNETKATRQELLLSYASSTYGAAIPHFEVFADYIVYPDYPAIPAELVNAELYRFDAPQKILYAYKEEKMLARLQNLLVNAQGLGFEPKTYDLYCYLVLTGADGSTVTLGLDAMHDLFVIDGAFFDYGPDYDDDGSIDATQELLALLGLEEWPEYALP